MKKMLTEDDKQWMLTTLATKTEVSALKADMSALKADMSALKLEIERVETSLLTEFHKWSSPVEQRMRTHAAAMRALDLEIEAVQDRVSKLEGRQIS